MYFASVASLAKADSIEPRSAHHEVHTTTPKPGENALVQS